MKNIDLTYLYDMYIDEYEDESYVLSKEEFIETIEDLIRGKEF